MPQRAIEQFADATTVYVAEAFDVISYPRSKVVTGIMANAKNYRFFDPFGDVNCTFEKASGFRITL